MPVALPTYVPRWASLAPWAALTYVTVGERVVNDGGKEYACITAGNTGNAGGPTGVGADIPDPGAAAPIAHWQFIGVNAPAYAPATFSAGDRVTNAGNVYTASFSPGTPSTVAPTGMGPGPLRTIDGYVWQYIASAVAVLTTPTDGQADIGWVPGQYPPAEVMNKLLWGIYRWILWLKDLPNQSITWLAKQTIDVSTGTSALEVKGATSFFAIIAQGRGNNGVGLIAQGPTVVGQVGVGLVGNGGQGGGPGAQFAAIFGDSNGVEIVGHGTGSGLDATGGATGPGVTAKGGATSGAGLVAQATAGNSAGVDATPHGTGSGVVANASGHTGYCLECIPNNTRAPVFLGTLPGAPAAVEGSLYYDSTIMKLRICTNGGWETVTSV